MAYVSLYRKYRPLTFDDVKGQDTVIQILKNAIKNDQLAHAYVFSGPRGTGKTSMARILAKALNCREGTSPAPCLKCDLCNSIRDGNAMDVFEIDAASNRGIDEIRDIREKIAFAPVEGIYKIYIIDEVHMLTEPAFNALLKTLEEPPANTIFILATTDPQKIPVTILSRCQRLEFKRITIPHIIEALQQIALKENLKIEAKAIQYIAKHSEGGMRDAISLLDQIISFKGSSISADDVIEVLGTADFNSINTLVDMLNVKDITGIITLLDDLVLAGKNPEIIIQNILNHYRNIILAKAEAFSAIELTQDQLALITQQAQHYSIDTIKKIIAVLAKTQNDMRWYPNSRLLLEINLVELTQNYISNDSLKKEHLPAQKQKTQEVLAPQQQKPVVNKEIDQAANLSQPSSNPEKQEDNSAKNIASLKTLADVKHHWHDILKKVKNKKLSVYMLLIESEPIEMKDGKLILQFKNNYSFHKEKFLEKQSLAIFEQVIKEYVKEPIHFDAVLDKMNTPQTNALQQNKNSVPEGSVKTLVKMFDGKIVE